MKIAFKVIVMLLLPAIATAGMVHGYIRKDGTYVAPYYRSARSPRHPSLSLYSKGITIAASSAVLRKNMPLKKYILAHLRENLAAHVRVISWIISFH